MSKDRETTEHESFGMISFSRVGWGGGGVSLFGSSIKHGNIIRLRISRADLNRDLSRDCYYAKDDIVEADMSFSQFAEAITSMNTSGIPCTLAYVGGKRMEPSPYVSKREQFEDEFAASCKDLSKKVEDLQRFAAELAERPVKKADTKDLINKIVMLKQQIASSLPFVHSQFNEQMDKTVMEAKGEVEAFVQHKIVSAGLDALGGKPLVAIEGARAEEQD